MKTTCVCPFCDMSLVLAVEGDISQLEGFAKTDLTANGEDQRRFRLWHTDPLCELIQVKTSKRVDAVIMKVIPALLVEYLNKENVN